MDEKTRARFAAEHRRGLIEKARAGDADAGRAMLQHSMAAMRRAANRADDADALALRWMADALEMTFSGVTLDRAVGLERAAGRPAHSPIRRFLDAVPIWRAVNDLAESLQAQGVSDPRREAQRRVGQQLGKSTSAIRAACALVAKTPPKGEPTE